MFQIWLRSDGRVEKRGVGYTQTHKGTLQLYIVDSCSVGLLFSKKIIARSVKYCFPMCSGMFEVYKNRNILQFAPFLYLGRI